MRLRIMLLAADGLSNTEIARRQSCSLPTAGKWRQCFLDGGLDGLLDDKVRDIVGLYLDPPTAHWFCA